MASRFLFLNQMSMPDAYIDPTRETFAAFREMERPGPVHMLNLLRFHTRALYPDGRDVSGAEAYRAHATESGPVLEALGGRQIWLGTPELTLIGPASER